MFLVNSRYPRFSATRLGLDREGPYLQRAHLLPKLRCHFAEFLREASLKRLGMLYLPTCVGLGYGHRVHSLEAFLGSVGSVTSPETARHRVSGLMRSGPRPGYSVIPDFQEKPRTEPLWCLYRKPTQVGGVSIPRRVREPWLRNSAK